MWNCHKVLFCSFPKRRISFSFRVIVQIWSPVLFCFWGCFPVVSPCFLGTHCDPASDSWVRVPGILLWTITSEFICNRVKIVFLALVFKLTWEMAEWKLTRKLVKPMSMQVFPPACGAMYFLCPAVIDISTWWSGRWESCQQSWGFILVSVVRKLKTGRFMRYLVLY